MRININRNSDTPIYLQIKNQIRDMIISGELPAGCILPPERSLSELLNVNRSTVVKVYHELKSDSLVESNADIDIAVLPDFRNLLSAREKVEIVLELEDLFGVSRVDLVILPEADPFLAVNAIRGVRIYCNDDHRADEYELYVLRRAGDLIPLERERISIIMEEKG